MTDAYEIASVYYGLGGSLQLRLFVYRRGA